MKYKHRKRTSTTCTSALQDLFHAKQVVILIKYFTRDVVYSEYWRLSKRDGRRSKRERGTSGQ
jgi:hypothetical protein